MFCFFCFPPKELFVPGMALKLISLLLAQVALARLGQNASVLNRSNATSKDANVPLGEGSALEIMVNGTRRGVK